MTYLDKPTPEDRERQRRASLEAAHRVLTELLSTKKIPQFMLLVHKAKIDAVEITGACSSEGLMSYVLCLLSELEEKFPTVQFPLQMLRIVQEIEFPQAPATEPQPTHQAPEGKQ
jgi:hypothetical protein